MVASISAQKPVAASQVTLVQLMELTDANIAGIVHGGVVMKLVDAAAGLAIKHCGGLAVTVSMDEMSFLAPVHVGDTIAVKASVNADKHHVARGRRPGRGRAHPDGGAGPYRERLSRVRGARRGREPRPVPRLLTETVVQQRRERGRGSAGRRGSSTGSRLKRHRRDVEQLERPMQPSADEPGVDPPHLRF